MILSRHRDEQVMIGDDVQITIVDIRGDKVRLGIDAPVNVPVHRREVYDAIKAGSPDTKAPEPVNNEVQPVITREFLKEIIREDIRSVEVCRAEGDFTGEYAIEARVDLVSELLNKFFPAVVESEDGGE